MEIEELIARQVLATLNHEELIDRLLKYPSIDAPASPYSQIKTDDSFGINEFKNTNSENKLTPPVSLPLSSSTSSNEDLKYLQMNDKVETGNIRKAQLDSTFLQLIINQFEFQIDHNTICFIFRGIRLRSIIFQSKEGKEFFNLLSSGLYISKVRIKNPPGIQDSKKLYKKIKGLVLETNQALEFYSRNQELYEDVLVEIGLTLRPGYSNIIKKISNLKSIDIIVYEKEITNSFFEELESILISDNVDILILCHVTYPNVGEIHIPKLESFIKKWKKRLSVKYEVFLFFLDTQLKLENIEKMFICHPGPNIDFKRINWSSFTQLKSLNLKVIHLYLGYIVDCLPPFVEHLRINFSNFTNDCPISSSSCSWTIPESLIELELDTFPTGEVPLESLLQNITWIKSNLKKLSLCWNKVFDPRGQTFINARSLPASLELLEVAGCGYEVYIICDKIPTNFCDGKLVYYAGEYGGVYISTNDCEQRLTWMSKP